MASESPPAVCLVACMSGDDDIEGKTECIIEEAVEAAEENDEDEDRCF